MLFLFGLVFVLLYLGMEWHIHVRSLQGIPLRIHIHGTRGKSSLTKEVAARLRNRGIRTLARTTGDQAELILPDGTTERWKRKGPARIKEYVGITRRASHLRCQAMVIECMALQPETISLAGRLLQANYILITNTRPDHQEVMGETYQDIAWAMSLLLSPARNPGRTIRPCGQVLIVYEDEGADLLAEEAKRRSCEIRIVKYKANTPPWEQPRLLADALDKVLDSLPDIVPGVPRGLPIPSFSPNFFTPPTLSVLPGSEHLFLDLFSVNDVTSAQKVFQICYAHAREKAELKERPWVALLATRPNRPLRTKFFVRWLAKDKLFALTIPVGWHCWYAQALLPAGHYLPSPLPINLTIPWYRPCHLLAMLKDRFGPCIIVGLGNVHGYGEMFRNYSESGLC